jgi:hypothetical protein
VTATALHIQRLQGWHDAWHRDAGAQWAKIVDPPENVHILPSVPNVVVRFWGDDAAPGYIAGGYEGGRQYIRDVAERFGRVQARGKVLELWNEPDCNSNVGLRNLNSATMGAIAEANARGIKLCVINAAEGNPHDNGTGNESVVAWKWHELVASIKAAVASGHYLGRHCYWRPGVEGPAGRWHALGRLRADIEALRALTVDVSRLQVLVGETGIDGGIAGHPAQQGWRQLTTPEGYRAEIVELERYLTGLPQVQAAFLFTSGFYDPWGGFEIDEGFAGGLIAPLREVAMPVLARPIRMRDVVRVTQRFGGSHAGIDYSCYEGTPVYAAAGGVAHPLTDTAPGGGFGRYVRIDSAEGGLYIYAAHLRSTTVAPGERVQAGDLIGYSGNTGNSTGPHLHFEVRRGSRSSSAAIDPEPLLTGPEPAPVRPEREPLPEDEQGPPGVLAQKARWWQEEQQRAHEAGRVERADEIRVSLIRLLYRLERDLAA